ncbi:cation:proton antiporter [Pontiella agarivorans]|uniref:Cation:proton antiporter n=1 Tax=Pontiella agarivorans TaxID=3038953 RepID=A0ABU5N196_9BACT|nr:cation:proton antiporter [Pontiella agarivorans]MDZ8120121.1 cation:proton antiporter [Pontiella agarivorans]
MGVESHLVFVCIFLIGLCATSHYFRKSPLPIVCWIVLFGIIYGFLQEHLITQLPRIFLNPDVILYLILPVLIFDSTRKLRLKEAEAVVWPATVLATLGILVSMFVMAMPLLVFTKIPGMDLLLFCGIMSATDPVAVSAIFRVFPVPEKLKMLVEGESLLNDGTTVILFSLLYTRVIEGHDLIFADGVMQFVLSVSAALLLGVTAGAGCVLLMRSWRALKDHFIAPLLPLIAVYLVFCAAQGGFDVSGVIAVMAATLTMERMVRKIPRAEMPNHMDTRFYKGFWDFLSELANSILFFILGAEIGSHTDAFQWSLILISLVALLFSRSVVIYGFGVLFSVFRFRLPLSWMHVLNLGGLKGALSVALILMLPVDYRFRNVFLHTALVLSIFTLVVNILVVRGYLKKADLNVAG